MTNPWKKVRNGVLVLGLLAGAGVAAWAWSRGPSVLVVRVQRAEVVQTVVASGRVLPPSRLEIASVVLGAVRAVHVDVGDRVTAGETLVELDDADARAQLERARASVGSAQARRTSLSRLTSRVAGTDADRAAATVAQARATVERYERLRAVEAVTGVELENARTALAQAEAAQRAAVTTATEQSSTGSEGRALVAGVTLARADITAAEARLAQFRIVAPVDGVVLARSVEPGDVAQPGTVMLVVASLGETTVRIDPDETTLSLLREGLAAIASAEAFPTERFDATVSSIAPSVDAERGTVEVGLRVPEPPPYLRTDMTVSVEIECARHPNALSVAAEAVRDVGTERPWVMLVVGDRTERRGVTLGLRGRDAVEILRGLAEGDRVVPATEVGVEAGMRVRPREDPAS